MQTNSNQQVLRKVINKVVKDPDYAGISRIPLFSYHQFALLFLSYACVLTGIYLAYKGVSLWIAYPISIIGFYSSFTPLHDATHHAVSSNKIINDILGSLSGGLLFPFVSVPMYRYFHLSHHRYLGDKDLDPDEAMVGIPTKYFLFGYLVFFLYEYFIFKWLFTSVWKKTPNKTKYIIIASLIANLAFHFVMLNSSIWQEYLYWFLIPNRLGIGYITYTFAHLPHPEGVHSDQYPFESTYTLTGYNILRESLWGQADHSMHHFLPNVPWYNYKKLWSLANGILKQQNIPNKAIFAAPDPDYKNKIQSLENKQNNKLTVRVDAIEQVAKNIKSFTFSAHGDSKLPLFTSGAHIDIHLPSGKIRPYSLISKPSNQETYQIAVKKEDQGRGGSVEMHESIKTGDTLQISYPKNNFMLYENVKKYILISGGIGITPLLSMAHRLHELDKHFEFHICAKSKEETPFHKTLQQYAFAPNIDLHLDENGKSTIELDKVLSSPDQKTLIYVCGPIGFNNWILQSAKTNGWNSSNVMFELFSAKAETKSDDISFDLSLIKSKKTIQVKPNESIIAALEKNNIKVDYSCLRGTCGTCIVNVKEGQIDHRDSILTPEEKQTGYKICLCVSRAKGDKLSIDL